MSLCKLGRDRARAEVVARPKLTEIGGNRSSTPKELVGSLSMMSDIRVAQDVGLKLKVI
jgi:hypothetical protein